MMNSPPTEPLVRNGTDIYWNHMSISKRLDRPQRKRSYNDQNILEILATSPNSEEFFAQLARQIVEVMDVACVLITEVVDTPATRVRTIAACTRTGLLDNFEIELEGGPCKQTIAGQVTFYGDTIQSRFPECGILKAINAESYCGVPVFDGQNRVIGHVLIADDKKMEDSPADGPVLRIFAKRVAAELDRARSHQWLKGAERQLREIIDTALDAIVVINQSGCIVDWNPSAQDMFGWTREEVLGRLVHEIVIPERLRQDHVAGLKRMLETGESNILRKRTEVFGVRRNGREFPAEITVTLLHDRGEMEFAAFVRDLTPQRDAERRLLETQDRLAYFSRLNCFGEIASGIAHELKQPLSAISNFAGALKSTEDPALVKEAIEAIGELSFRAGDIVRRFRNLANKSPSEKISCRLQDLVAETIQLIRHDLYRKGITLVTDMSSDLPDIVVNKVEIQQVVLSLLRNSIEAIDRSPESARNITLRAFRAGDQVEVIVEDAGEGISISDVFEPFVTTKENGMGMGLAISRTIIETHGGKIRFERNDEGVTRFYFRVPIEPDETD